MIEIEVEDESWARALSDPAGLAREAAALAARNATGEIAILLADDATLRRLNARYLGKDRPTNVLAFPSTAAGSLGDVALAFGVCQAEAAEQGKSLADHLRHLVIHGVLHLIGYDHVGDEDAASMELLERQLLAELSIPDPYA
ncbi:MAG TPA: rRNA maturation RNase YbeY [Caulobacteraceae bacterium]